MPAGQTFNRIDDLIGVGETDRWIDVYAQPDYLVFEPDPLVTDPPTSGWSQTMVECTYVDAFTAGFPLVTNRTLYNGTDTRDRRVPPGPVGCIPDARRARRVRPGLGVVQRLRAVVHDHQ